MADEKWIKNIKSTFSMYGLIATRDITTFILRYLKTLDEDERENALRKIIEEILNLNLSDPHIKVNHIEAAIKEYRRPDTALHPSETLFNIINTPEMPKIVWNVEQKKFVLQKVSNNLIGTAQDKSSVFKDRLDLIKRITLRNDNFIPRKPGETNVDKFELTSIEYLKSNCKSGEVYVLGMLSQLVEGKLYLEDKDASVKLDLKKTSFPGGLIAEGSIVIANGIFEDGILNVDEMGLPPAESSEESRLYFGSENTFGGSSKISLKLSEKLKIYEQSHENNMLIILSDVWLDNLEVLNRINTIMAGYSDDPPVAFIFCGNFLSTQTNISSASKLKEGFDNLAKIIKNYPDILQYSKFIFVPGPLDLGAPKILPRCSLPTKILADFTTSIPGAIFATNPCRIQYCTKEIVIFRENVITKMSRSALKYPNIGHIWDHYARTIICQAHLAPMSLASSPVYWTQDHTLQLFPTPDVIIVADEFKSYNTSYKGCKVLNPGPFPQNNYSFLAYKPGMNLIEECEVPKDDDF